MGQLLLLMKRNWLYYLINYPTIKTFPFLGAGNLSVIFFVTLIFKLQDFHYLNLRCLYHGC